MCDYQGYEFGAGRYPDSICIDGFLYDADTYDADDKMVSVPDEKLPCPKCNNKLNFLLNDGVKNMVEAECKNCGVKWEYVDDSTFECSDIGEEICPHCETAHIEFNKGIGA